jgi:SAM-dependent methyltransferase
MAIEYCHRQNRHSIAGAAAALPQILCGWRPRSILDVGCGTGTWMRAALDVGVRDVFGIDGVEVDADDLAVEASRRTILDLTQAWRLERRFDLLLCLEVAEHLGEPNGPALIDALVAHTDYVVFSAACPSQQGQHHVNCQWPEYWQSIFNQREFVCSDEVRWRIWDDERIEPWYRQNIFVATRDKSMAGREPRIRSVIHPKMWSNSSAEAVEHGYASWQWYVSCIPLAFSRKALRRLKKIIGWGANHVNFPVRRAL